MIVTRCSGNSKIGPVAATYRPVGPTCPPCAMASDCYALRHRVAMIQRRSGSVEGELSTADGAPLIRHHVSGDFFTESKNGSKLVDRKYVRRVASWHEKRPQRYTEGWTYTHGPDQLERAGFGPEYWPNGLTVLASCETIDRAKELQSRGWRTARVTTQKDRQDGEAYCPYDLAKSRGQQSPVNCASCRLCFDDSNTNIVFLKF